MPLCTPSRAALMTGLYPIHTGMQSSVILDAAPWGLPLEIKILPQHFKDLGYEVNMIGKWHLGFYKTEYTPTRRGFDSFFGFYTAYNDYYNHTAGMDHIGYDSRDYETPILNETGYYNTHRFTNRFSSLVENRNKSKSTDPQIWFVQVESRFATQRITADMAMILHVVFSLSPTIATEVRDLLLTPPVIDA
ncbi:arylsulfatase B [Ixodes scapularis]